MGGVREIAAACARCIGYGSLTQNRELRSAKVRVPASTIAPHSRKQAVAMSKKVTTRLVRVAVRKLNGHNRNDR